MFKNLHNISFLLIFCLSTSVSHGAEVDSWVTQDYFIADSVENINLKTNELIDQAIEKANGHGQCDSKDLYREMRKNLRFLLLGKLIRYLYWSDEVDRAKVKVRKSVFRDFKPGEAIVLGGVLRLLNANLAGMVQVGPYRVGIDKFEHFLGSGFRYFKKRYIKGEDLEKVLEAGRGTELGILGRLSTGVISHADLIANFNGMRFWNHVLATGEDPLGAEYQVGPYVVCSNNRWIRVQDMNWLNYFDPAFDESLNCNSYRTERLDQKVSLRIAEIEGQKGTELQCDPHNAVISDLRAGKYAPVARWIFPKKVFIGQPEFEDAAP